MIGEDGGVIFIAHVSPNPCHMTTGKNSWLSVVTEGDARGIWTTAAEQVFRNTAMERLQKVAILLRIMEMIILLYWLDVYQEATQEINEDMFRPVSRKPSYLDLGETRPYVNIRRAFPTNHSHSLLSCR